MKKNLIKILVMLAVFVGIILVTNQVQAGSIKLNSLNFQIQLNEDGSMDGIENWMLELQILIQCLKISI